MKQRTNQILVIWCGSFSLATCRQKPKDVDWKVWKGKDLSQAKEMDMVPEPEPAEDLIGVYGLLVLAT